MPDPMAGDFIGKGQGLGYPDPAVGYDLVISSPGYPGLQKAETLGVVKRVVGSIGDLGKSDEIGGRNEIGERYFVLGTELEGGGNGVTVKRNEQGLFGGHGKGKPEEERI